VYRFLLSPRWVALQVLALVLVVAFVVLGFWQLGRFGVQRTAGDAAPAPLTEVVAPGPESAVPEDAADRLVTVSGRYLPGEQVLVAGRVRDGVLGYHVVTPVLSSEGATLLVDRGWVAEPAAAAPAPAAGVTLTGFLREAETAADSGPITSAGPPAGQVLFIGERLIDRLPQPAYRGYLQLTEQQPPAGTAPAPLATDAGQGRHGGVGPGVNLGYAAQWWAFAAAVVFFLVRAARLEVADRRTSERTRDPKDAKDVQPRSAGSVRRGEQPLPAHDLALGDKGHEGDRAGEQDQDRAPDRPAAAAGQVDRDDQVDEVDPAVHGRDDLQRPLHVREVVQRHGDQHQGDQEHAGREGEDAEAGQR
jgi:cytochrome oxidase assembly protein ShyY1